MWKNLRLTPGPSRARGWACAGIRTRNIHGELYWGYAFRNVNTEEKGLQDHGIHFALDVALF